MLNDPTHAIKPVTQGLMGDLGRFFGLGIRAISAKKPKKVAASILNEISRFETILWDWNGTLLNDAHIAAEAESELFRRHGMKVQSREERMQNFVMPVET